MGRYGVSEEQASEQTQNAQASSHHSSSDGEEEKVANERAEDLTEPFLVIESLDLPRDERSQLAKERLAALDVFRGLSIAMMILADNAGGAWPAINHSPWNGVTMADLVMPFFLFIVGVSLALAYKRIQSGRGATEKAVLRTIKLLLLGALLQGGYFHGANSLQYGVDMDRIRWCGILQRIAFVYFVVAMCEIWLPRLSEGERFQVFRVYLCHWFMALVLAAVYLSLLYGLYVPNWQFELPSNRNITLTVHCGTRGDLGPACNAVGYVDRSILGVNHLHPRPVYRRTKACSLNSPDYGPVPANAPVWCYAPFDPEGILSSVSAIATCFIGLHYGHLLIHMKEHRTRILNFVWPAVLLALAGLSLHFLGIPLNKPLYSISYVCFTAGIAGLVFCAFYALVDVYGYRYPTILLEWMGMNSLLIYVLAATDVLVVIVQGFYWKKPDNNLVTFLGEHILYSLIPAERWSKLVYVLLGILCWALVAGALKARGIFWKL